MVTVFERCQHFGYTDNITTSRVGELTAIQYFKSPFGERIRIWSEEPHGKFLVWSYPDAFVSIIDHFIQEANREINTTVLKSTPLRTDRPKRKRIDNGR